MNENHRGSTTMRTVILDALVGDRDTPLDDRGGSAN